MGKRKRNHDFDLLIEVPWINVKVLVCACEETWRLETKMWETFVGGPSRRDLPGKCVR